MAYQQPFSFGKKLFDGQNLDEAFASPTWSLANNVAAKASGTNVTSTQLTETINIVTSVPVTGAGVILPSAIPGRIVVLENTSGNDMTVFAKNNSTINGVDNGTGFLHPSYTYLVYIAIAANAWQIMNTSSYHGSFYDTTLQTNTDNTQPQKMTFNSTAQSSGVSIVAGSQITTAFAGTYNIQFSAQFDKTDGGTDTVDIWQRYNGVDVPNSNTRMTLSGTANASKTVASWNFLQQMAAGSYVELMWFSADAGMEIYTESAQTNPTRPAIPSILLTVQGV
jgi:hypothetical protein